MTIALSSLLLAFLISYFATPWVRKAALVFDFVDRPDGHRKIQARPVALGGGLALMLATMVSAAGLAALVGPDILLTSRVPHSLIGLGLAAVLLGTVGLWDDRRGLPGSVKLVFQVVAACLVMGTGVIVTRLQILDVGLSLSFVGLLFTIAWLLGAVNSFNLIDGVDGLAASVGIVFSLTIGIMALLFGTILDAMIMFALAGALLGFLRYNLAPASIYLGDTGSMFIGLVLGAVALRCFQKQTATVAFAAPLAIWSIPIFDSMAAVLRRKLTGRSIYATDRGHIHHVLLTKGMTPNQTVLIISGLCVLTSVGAVISTLYDLDWFGVLVVVSVFAFLIAARVFGHVEFLLINARLQGLGQFLTSFTPAHKRVARQSRMRLQGTGRLEQLWEALVESAERFHIVRMRLNVCVPRLHEHFYATWHRAGAHRRDLRWQTDIPLVVDEIAIGRLEVSGLQNSSSASTEMSHFIDFVESLEQQLRELLEQQPAPAVPVVVRAALSQS